MTLPTKCIKEGFDINAYKLFVKAGYNPNEPSRLGRLLSEGTTSQAREGLGYTQPPPICISIRREVSNYITVEESLLHPIKSLLPLTELENQLQELFLKGWDL